MEKLKRKDIRRYNKIEEYNKAFEAELKASRILNVLSAYGKKFMKPTIEEEMEK